MLLNSLVPDLCCYHFKCVNSIYVLKQLIFGESPDPTRYREIPTRGDVRSCCDPSPMYGECLTYPYPICTHDCPVEVHDDVIRWKHFPRYWPFVRGIHRSPVNSPHKGQWHGCDVFFDLHLNIYKVNNREAGDLRRYPAHYDVTVMCPEVLWTGSKVVVQLTHPDRLRG